MHDIGEGTIRRIDWQELMPVVLLLRILTTTLGLRLLFVSLIGTFLFLSLCSSMPYQFGRIIDAPVVCPFPLPSTTLTLLDRSVGLPLHCFYNCIEPFWIDDVPFSQAAIWFFGNAVIGFFVIGILSRRAAVRLTIDESESLPTIFRFFWKRGIGFISSVLILCIGILCCLLPVKIAAWLAGVSFLQTTVGVLLPIPMFFAFFASILLIGLVLGFPL
ncbi:MAG: hypothetical protein LBU65_06815, partial [Planctomycetaceae bacterium]|nr:hypothetical protein [Planctomycetaceae bacterium]